MNTAKPSDEQMNIINYNGDTLLVNAAPGSGKTRSLLGHAMRYKKKSPKSKVLILAFSKPAQLELKDRLQTFGVNGIETLTFHAFCFRSLRPFIDNDNIELNPGKCKKIIWDLVKNNDVTYNTLSHDINNYQNGKEDDYKHKELIKEYQAKKKQQNIIDYDDLHPMFIKLFDAGQIDVEYNRIYVDEGHDLNIHQIELLKRIVKPNPTKFFGIMSKEQSIYGFRGANPNLLQKFCDSRGNCVIKHLSQNFRSGPSIVNFATKLSGIEMNPNQSIKDNLAILEPADSAFAEAEAIANKIQDSNENATILYRVHKTSANFERSLSFRNIPYFTVESDSFFEIDEIKTINKYLKLAQATADVRLGHHENTLTLLDIVNKPFRWFTYDIQSQLQRNIEGCNNFIKGLSKVLYSKNRNQMGCINKKSKELIDQLLILSFMDNPVDQIQYIRNEIKLDKDILKNNYSTEDEADESLFEPLNNLEEIAKDFKSTKDFVSFIDNIKPVDKPEYARVLLMTAHASKGKEFDNVYVVSSFMYPYKEMEQLSEEEVQEEKNLLFVACTRAKQKLVVSSVNFHSCFIPNNYIPKQRRTK